MNILDENFDYDYAITNRYDIPNKMIRINDNNIKLELLVTNGFVKLYTVKGRLYWYIQGKSLNVIPDWKLHFNVQHSDISKAWKIISETLLYYKMNKSNKVINEDIFIAMKAININLNKNFPEFMSGREITVYIYQYDPKLNENKNNTNEIEYENEKKEKVAKKVIYSKEEEENFNFWYEFLFDVEEKLKKANIKKQKPKGCAEGDLYLGKYTSLRNESFIYDEYPPNETGWNARKQNVPFSSIQIYKIRKKLLNEESVVLIMNEYKFYIISLFVLAISLLLYLYHY